MDGSRTATDDATPAGTGRESCHGPSAKQPAGTEFSDAASAHDFGAYVKNLGQGVAGLNLLVEGIHCGGCIRKIEGALARCPEVIEARLNFTTHRLAVKWRGGAERAETLAGTVTGLGYRVVPYDPDELDRAETGEEKALLRALAVAGFAAGNVMLLSVSIWAGYFQDMGPATRDLLHWFSTLIALPAILYAGQPFFRSALAAVRSGHMNMDVPISLAVILAAGMSLFETIRGGPHAYFDSAVTLLFFLLIGRYLDKRARGRARSAVQRLLALGAKAVTILDAQGRQVLLPPQQVTTGLTALVAAGERIAVDGRVIDGRSDVDISLITGESVPVQVAQGDQVFAGTLNHSAPLKVQVTAIGEQTLLSEIVRLMELAEQRKARHVALADRIARLYAPAVHGLALATFLGWISIMAAPWQVALLHAVAVLIITCPCALGLAVPVVQVIASGRLMRRGILLKSATALERLAEIDTIVFDKTGTLTLGRPELAEPTGNDPDDLQLAASMSAASRHPLARALARAVPDTVVATGIEEVPGSGLRMTTGEGEVRLGNRAWCDVTEDGTAGPELWLRRHGSAPCRFSFEDPLRPDAAAVIADLKRQGFKLGLLSGDRKATVESLAIRLGIDLWQAACQPAEKCARLEELAAEGRRVLMVGDGLNDAPALAAAYVSLSPTTAADISRTAADTVFQGDRLEPLLELLRVAKKSDRLVKENFALAFAYNIVTVPLAVAGLVTPLIAALAMSASSLVVVGNALRLSRRTPS